jgi:nitroreductase
MYTIYQAALRAPDHAGLKPSRFIEISGNGLNKLSDTFERYAKKNIDKISKEQLDKYKKMPYRAPMIIVLISKIKDHKSVPEIEQIISTGAAGNNILLALNALNYSGIWRTGIFAFNEKVAEFMGLEKDEKIIGYIYVGTPSGPKKELKRVELLDYVTKWN